MIISSRPIIVIAGPTASGKSSIATRLAKDINGVIINGDSRQIYKEISIGTARPDKKDMRSIPHYLYGHISVKDNYNIYRYQEDFQKTIDKIEKEKTPILVGGTGLYIDSVIFNYKLNKSSIDIKQREELNKLSITELTKQIDPAIINKLNESDKQNPVRLIRIIEKGNVKNIKGKELKHIYFVIDQTSENLKEKIIQRVEWMFSNGLLEENIMIRKNSLENYSAFKTIGYQEFNVYFSKEKSLEEVKEEIIKNTIRYAKRQKTWFRRHKKALWSNDYDYILEQSLKFIKI